MHFCRRISSNVARVAAAQISSAGLTGVPVAALGDAAELTSVGGVVVAGGWGPVPDVTATGRKARRPRLSSVHMLHMRVTDNGGMTGAWQRLPSLKEARSGCRAVWTNAAAVTPARLVVLGGHGSSGVNRAYTLSTVETLAIGVAEELHHPDPHHLHDPSHAYFKGDTWLPTDGQRKGWLKKHWRGSHTHHHQFFVLSHQPGRHGLWYFDHQTELDHLGLSERDRRMRVTEMGIQPAGIIHTQHIKHLRAGLTPTKIEIVCAHPKRRLGRRASLVEQVLILEAETATDAYAWMQALHSARSHHDSFPTQPMTSNDEEHKQRGEESQSEADGSDTEPAWQPLPCMLNARSHFGCTALTSGRIAVAGGCGDKGVLLDFAEIFEPHGAVGAGRWRALPNLPIATEGCSLAFLAPPAGHGAGMLLLAGGGSSSSGSTDGCLVLSLGMEQTWSAGLGCLRVPRTFASLHVAGSVVWIAGGRLVGGEELDCATVERNGEWAGAVDKGHGQWEVINAINIDATRIKIGAVGGVVVLGGRSQTGK
jgi:hypothetical protein